MRILLLALILSIGAHAATPEVLLFNGTGTSADVRAVEAVLHTLGQPYVTIDSAELNSITEEKLISYKLLIVPGGNSIIIGNNLTKETTTMIREAVQNNGLHYLGICAGAFFGGFGSRYNNLNLTNGVWFDFYSAYYHGVRIASEDISMANGSDLDVYWQDGPQLTGWGKIVAKFPDGTPAIVEGYSGKGWVVLSGVHPEAPASWRTCCTFTTPLDTDLNFAGRLIESALYAPLPHF